MAKWQDWHNEAKAMSKEQLLARKNAIQLLMTWPMFAKEFGSTGIGVLSAELEVALSEKKVAD